MRAGLAFFVLEPCVEGGAYEDGGDGGSTPARQIEQVRWETRHGKGDYSRRDDIVEQPHSEKGSSHTSYG